MSHNLYSKKPLVVVLGFLGAKPRYVKKYASLVESLRLRTNILTAPDAKSEVSATAPANTSTTHKLVAPVYTHPEVVSYIPPVLNAIQPRRLHESSARILDLLIESRGPERDRPVYYYLLSNNGSYSFAHFVEFMKRHAPEEFDRYKKYTTGIIWDSCPCDANVEVFTRGFTSIVSGLWSTPPLDEHKMITPWMRHVFEFLLESPKRKHIIQDIHAGLYEDMPELASHLFLTSQADTLIPYKLTYEYAKQRADKVDAALKLLAPEDAKRHEIDSIASPELNALKSTVSHQLGRRVWLHDFVDSAHVDHLRTYPQKYTSIVKNFMQHTVQTQVPPKTDPKSN